MTNRLASIALLLFHSSAFPDPLPRETGYRGIWYMNQPTGDEHRYKYSGGLGTYPQQLSPFAWHAEQAKKTFFCYGGKSSETGELLHMVSYFDHETGEVPRPRGLLNKKTTDAHDNPVICLDEAGHVWIFSSAHGRERPAFVHRSKAPYAIDEFERVLDRNFSYAQPHVLPGKGFLFLHTLYSKEGRGLFWTRSPDGMVWPQSRPLSHFGKGHYQVSSSSGESVATVFNYHPDSGGLNARTNLYFLETRDGGRTWRAADRTLAEVPMGGPENPGLVRDFEKEGLLVYLKSVEYDAEGKPVILFLTSRGWAPGPENGPRVWRTARWDGARWVFNRVTESDHNYDFGPLYIEEDGTWRIMAPTEPGPQPDATGGEIAMWRSEDEGRTWTKVRQLTRNSKFNHTYVRKPKNAHPEFYAFWADGNPLEPSESRLYFTDRDGSEVFQLPVEMEEEYERPEQLSFSY